MSEFNKAIKNLLGNFEDYIKAPYGKSIPVTNKDHIVFKAIVNDLPLILKKELAARNLDNIEHIEIKGSTRDGYVGESFWIAFLDERITRSTKNGVYIVLLFDKFLNKVYLTIGSGTEDSGLKNIREKAKERRKHFAERATTDFNDFTLGDIFLGVKTRAKKFAASVCISKSYNVNDLNLDELLKDIKRINSLYYDYIYQVYMNKNEQISNQENSKKTRNKISKKKYAELRKEQQKRNSEVGDKAEKFIYELEKRKLRNAGVEDYANRVQWIAKDYDGLGYDIESFFEDGTRKYIEVKGSSFSLNDFTFYLSKREKEVAEELRDSYIISLVQSVGTEKISIFEEIVDPMKVEYEYFEPQSFKVVKSKP